MQIQHEEGATKGRYWTGDGAELTYSVAGRAVAVARAAGRSIVPFCPYALRQFHHHPEWRDVWNGGPKT